MIQWKEERVIPVHIEKLWELFLDKNIMKTMPKVEEHILIEKTEGEVGAKHQQKYREGKRVETYIVETLAYENQANHKLKQITFVLGKAFEINLKFELQKIDETNTRFIYSGYNKGVNFVGRAMLKLGSEKANQKVVEEYMDRVEAEAVKL